jgi:hypothetical protein
MAKEWANKNRYHPSNGVLEPHMPMLRAKVILRTVPAWGVRKVAGAATGRAPSVRLVHYIGQTGAGLDRQWVGFCAHEHAWFGSGGHGSGGWHGESVGG